MWIRTHYCLILRHFRSWYLLETSYAGMCDVRVCVSIYDINIEFMSGWTIRYFFHSRPSRIPIPTNFVVCLCVRHDFSHFKRFHIYHMHGGPYKREMLGANLCVVPNLPVSSVHVRFSIFLLKLNRFWKTLFQLLFLFQYSVNTLYTLNTSKQKRKKWEKYCFDFKHKIWCINTVFQ